MLWFRNVLYTCWDWFEIGVGIFVVSVLLMRLFG